MHVAIYLFLIFLTDVYAITVEMIRNAKRKDGVLPTRTDRILGNAMVIPLFVMGMMYRHVEDQLSIPQLLVCVTCLVILAWFVAKEISKKLYKRQKQKDPNTQ